MIINRLKKWKWPLTFLVFSFLGLFFVTQNALSYLLDNETIPWDRVFYSEMLYWYIWFALTPPILWFARWIPFDKQRWKEAVFWHLLISLVVAPLQNGLWYCFHFLLIEGNTLSEIITNFYKISDSYWIGVLTSFYKYWLLIGAYYGIVYYQQYREHEKKVSTLEVETARLNTRLVQSRLDLLKMQLHPHFLFNAMNTISVYMEEDVDKAKKMLIRLSELLRITLESKEIQEVSLSKEIDVLNYYLEIEKARFEDKLKIDWNMDPETMDGLVPYLFLQPILENAIHHGITTNQAVGQVSITSIKKDGRLNIRVVDNGIGDVQNEDIQNGTGIGLSNTRERLRQLYGEDFFFDLENKQNKGTVVTIEIPHRRSSKVESPEIVKG